MPETFDRSLKDLAATYDAAPIGVCAGREDGTVIYTNPAFDQLASADHARSLLQRGESEAYEEHIGDNWLRISCGCTQMGGEDLLVLWVIDVTALKRAEHEARTMHEMKSSFLATMSHEIRTPMQSVFGLLELIADEDISAPAQAMVQTARSSASGLLEILDDILDLAKVEAGKIELDHFEVPLRTLIYGVLEGMNVKLVGKKVSLEADVASDVPFVIGGDPTRLRQILLNLVGNAMKFTEKGSITVRITRNVQHITAKPDGLALRFEVIDTGMGMSEEIAQKLFKPFTQADTSTTRRFGGTGLGLSICKRLVDLMGGKIGVDSTLGEGSCFWFEIPTTELGTDTRTELPNLEGLAVLSVEDHPQGAKEIFTSLRSMGAEVISCPTYAQGLDMLNKRPFDVAVIDQGLPDGLGVDLMKEAARIRPYMGLILYTVRDDEGLQYSARVLGAKYLAKPASRLGLGEAVRAAARQHVARDHHGPRRLLIAEDTQSVREVLARQLEKLGIEADFVTTGIEALDVLNQKRHGLLFTDLHMPDMDGYQLVAAIRATEESAHEKTDAHKRFPVIALTADVQLAQRQAYLSHGFDECLLKPVSLGQFRQLLIRWGVLDQSTQDKPQPSNSSLAQTEPEDTITPPALDRKAVTEQMGGFDQDVIDMLKMFITITAPQITKIKTENDPAALKELAHSLKGAARSAGCMILGDLAQNLETSCAQNAPIDRALIHAIEHEFARARTEIENITL